MKTVLVTGAAGFIGQHLCLFLEKNGYHVLRVVRTPRGLKNEIVCNLTSSDEVQKLFSHHPQINFLIHLAAHAVPTRNLEDLSIQQLNTVLPALHVAQFVPASVQLALFTGSCEEYGRQTELPFKENQIPHPISPYGWGKASAYSGVDLISRTRSINWTWIRPFLTYGPQDRTTRTIIPYIAELCRKNEKINLTPGEQTRDFLYIEDFNRMILKILAEPSKAVGQILNLCTGEPRTIKEVATKIHAILKGGELCFGAIPYRSNEQMLFYGSKEKFETLYGTFEFTPFDEALEQTLRYST